MFAEFVAGFDALAGDAGRDSSLVQPSAQFGDVVGLIGVELGGSGASGTAPGAHSGDGPDEGFEGVVVVGVGRRNSDGQGQSGAVGQCVDLGAWLAAIHRIRASQ